MKKTMLLFAAVILCFPLARAADDMRTQKRDSILNSITGARIPQFEVNITKLGARGDGKKDCKPAFDKAMKAALRHGGAHIVVPAGVYHVKGPIHFVSNVCLDLQKGSVLRFSSDAKDYLPLVETSWEGTWLSNYSPMIYGRNLHDVSIIGEGIVDGNCATTFATWKPKQREGQMRSREMNHESAPLNQRKFGNGWWLRPHLIQLSECRNITLEGIFITNSPFWCVHLLKSENIICRNLRYDAKLINNDGIDPECSRNILIEDIHFNNGDDNIAIKSGRDNDGWTLGRPSENIIIRNCHFKGLHAVVIGSEMSAGVQHVFVENCDYAGYCKRGIFIKTNPDRGGFVRNIYVNDCQFGEVEDLFYVTSMYAGEGLGNNHYSEIEHLHVDGLRCNKARQAALVLQGTQEKPVRHVSFRNIEVGECKNAISFEHTEDVQMQDCFLGGRVGIPTQVTPKDKIFDK
ncbi:MAG: glycoside hydrolase family 28 protein [Prevotella sp.]|nr:glycoside hydrolase family 28 protein [Prevotella sp.]